MKQILFCIAALATLAAGQTNPYRYTSAQLKQILPEPVITDHPQYVELYWKAWEIFTSHIQAAPSGSRFVPYFIDEAFDAAYVFQWDTAFMLMFARLGFKSFPTIVSFDNFYMIQDAAGRISREPNVNDGSAHCFEGCDNDNNPPLFSWGEWAHFQLTADTARFSKLIVGWKDGGQSLTVLQRIVKHFRWLETNMSSGNGLFFNTAMGSGMDDTPREGQTWICMSAQMALTAYYIAKMAHVAGNAALETEFTGKFDAIKAKINSLLWDPQDKFYYDLYNSSFNRVKTPGSAWPLVARVAESAHAAGVVSHLTNPNEFWRPHVFPSLSKDSPDYNPNGGYWSGSVWAPLNYQAIKGLEEYGYDSIAVLASENHIQNMYDVYKSTGTIWENYAPESQKPGDARGDFVGWSGCGPIALLIENVIGIRAHAPENTIEWYVNRTEENGIRNYSFRDNTVSMICARRTDKGQAPSISIAAAKPFTLTVVCNGQRTSRPIPAGASTWASVPTRGATRLPSSPAGDAVRIAVRHHTLSVGTRSAAGVRVELYAASGAIVRTWVLPHSRSSSLNIDGLSAGVYTVKVLSGMESMTQRISLR